MAEEHALPGAANGTNFPKIATISGVLALGLFAGVAAAVIPATGPERPPMAVLGDYAYLVFNGKPLKTPVHIKVVSLDPITTNMRKTAAGRLIQMQVSLKTDTKRAAQLDALKPALRDAITFYLRSLDELDLEGSERLLGFKAEVRKRVALLDTSGAIDDVYIDRILFQ